MAGFILPVANLAGTIFNAINGGSANNKAAGLLANTQYGAAQDIVNSTGAGQGMVATAGNNAMTAVNDAATQANSGLTDSLGRQTQNLNPYLQTGQQGATQLGEFAKKPSTFSVQDWMNDPGYQFLLDQGRQAVNNSAAARGGAVGGNVLKDLTSFGQGLAATEYGNAFDRFMKSQGNDLAKYTAAANTGLSASSMFNNAEQGAGTQISNNTTNAARYTGDTQQSVAQFLANLGLQGTTAANNYRIGGANTQAAGILGKAANIAGAVNQGIQTIPSLMSALPGGGQQAPTSYPAGTPGTTTLQFPWVTGR